MILDTNCIHCRGCIAFALVPTSTHIWIAVRVSLAVQAYSRAIAAQDTPPSERGGRTKHFRTARQSTPGAGAT